MNTSLSKEQIAQLIAFLESRKFKDPIVMAEVLHNIENKVAQKLSDDQTLHVNDAIKQVCNEMDEEDKALRKELHMPGYTPAPVIYETIVKKKYKHILRGQLKNVLSNPRYALAGIAISAGMYFAYRWGNTHAIVWGDLNAVSLAVFVAYMVFSFLTLGKTVIGKPSSIQLGGEGWPVIPVITLVLFQRTYPVGSTILTVMSVLYALVCGFFFFSAIARYRTLTLARNNSEDIHSFYKEKQPWVKAA